MDIDLPEPYKSALEPHITNMVNAINKMLPIITEFGKDFTCKYECELGNITINIKKE